MIASRTLTEAETDAFGDELDALKRETVSKLGQRDVDHIRAMMRWVRYLEAGGRGLLHFGIDPVTFTIGTAALSVSKILENMEVGHNVMHGQYDWTHDPALDSRTYEWDTACTGDDWRHSHNYEHHTFTNVLGRPLSHPDYFSVFQAMRAHDLPVWIHPMRGASTADYASETASEDEIWFTFGWPYETSACVTRLIFAGIFDKLPGLKIVTHHYCGMIPFFAEKVALGFSQIFHGTPEHNPAGAKAGLKLEPIEYYRMLYADTAVNGSGAAATCGHAFFGTSHSLFATDAPFDPLGGANLIGRTIEAVNRLDITPAERARIFEGNAMELLKLNG